MNDDFVIRESRHLFTSVLRKSGIIFPLALIRTLATPPCVWGYYRKQQRPNILIPSPQLRTTHRLPLRPVEMEPSDQAHGCCRTSWRINIGSSYHWWKVRRGNGNGGWLYCINCSFLALWNGKIFYSVTNSSGGQLLSEWKESRLKNNEIMKGNNNCWAKGDPLLIIPGCSTVFRRHFDS